MKRLWGTHGHVQERVSDEMKAYFGVLTGLSMRSEAADVGAKEEIRGNDSAIGAANELRHSDCHK